MSSALQNVDDVYPLTATQEGLLYHSLAEPDSGVYINQVITPISGDLDADLFAECWNAVVARHETLRTAFVWDGLEDPLQVVRSAVRTEWHHLDLSALSAGEQDRRIAEFLRSDRHRGFSLAEAPLCRMALVRLGDGRWKWIWTFHHLIVDGWSANLIIDEVFERYGAGSETLHFPRAPRYRDFVAGYLARDEDREEAFWRELMLGFTEPHRLAIPGLPPAPEAARFQTNWFEIGARTSREIVAAARSLNVTLNAMFLGAWAIVLSRWTRSTDVVFGTTVAGRPGSLAGVEHATGLFINTIPQRFDVDPNAQLGSWLRDVQRVHIETREFEQTPLAAIQRWSDVEPGRAMFDSILVFENYPRHERSNGNGEIRVGERTYFEQSNYPLAMLVIPDDVIRLQVVSDGTRFSEAAVESLASQVEAVLAAMVAQPDGRLGSYTLVDEQDEAWLRKVGAGPEQVREPVTIHELIGRAAAASPEAVAVIDPTGSTTYSALMDRAGGVAVRLRAAGVGPNHLVGLHVHRSTEMIAGMLGILLAGGAYVPLDPAYPAAHLHHLLSDSEIDVVLTSSDLADGVPDDVGVVLVDGESAVVDADADAVGSPPAAATDLAYVIHTSGSTGRPKGVMVTHGNLVSSTRARDVHYGAPVETFLLLSSFSFDSSVAGIFWTLSGGGTLVLPAPGQEHDVETLLELAHRHRVTHTLCLPSLYEVLLEHSEGGELESLEVAIVAGEACPDRVLDAHRKQLPDAALHNEYGPTEGTVWCTAHEASGADEVLPIGRPIAGARVFLLDNQGNVVPPGFVGEICIAGSGVVPGYLGRPDLTAERFVSTQVLGATERLYRTGDLGAWREDGVLLYFGRSDAQLKVRGHRIEASAVETALRGYPAVREAVVVGRSAPDRPATQLVAYAAIDGDDLDTDDLKRTLAAVLPEFMVPDIVVPLETMPRLPNGKVDMAALPDPRAFVRAGGGFVEPRTDAERVLASIWSDLLEIESVGVQDDFFELGGDSIISIRMISRARQAGIQLTPGQITSHPTIEQLAVASTGQVSQRSEPVSGPVAIGPIQDWFFAMDHPVPNQWNQSVLLAVDAESDVDERALADALQACVAHHDMLRARFRRTSEGWEQWVERTVELRLETADQSAAVSEVMAGCHQRINLESGPVVSAALIRRPPGEADLLFLAAHHLVVDVVSWSIIIDDLEQAYLQASTGLGIELAPQATSYRDWINTLISDARPGERRYWTAEAVETGPPRVWGTEASRDTVTVQLDRETTGALLGAANDAYRTRPDELMIAAFVGLLAGGGDRVRVALERHGRSDRSADVDLSRTVGWFTAQFPLTFTGHASDPAHLISSVKETLRSVPDGGVGYGSLRYLHRLPELVVDAEPEHLFNYLGRTRSHSGGLLRPIPVDDAFDRHSDNLRAHRIEVVAFVSDDQLSVDWHFSTLHDDRPAVEERAAAYLEQLRSIVTHSLADGTGSFTPSDFPAAGLNQDELDAFLDDLA